MRQKSRFLLVVIVAFSASSLTYSNILGGVGLNLRSGIGHEKENPYHHNSVPESEQESSLEDNFSSEDEYLAHLSTLVFLPVEGSKLFHHIQSSMLSCSSKPPFSPPEFQSC